MEMLAARPSSARVGSFDAVAPVVAFLVVNRLAGLRWAVLAATVASIAVAVERRRRGQALGRFMPLITSLIIARGVIGIVTDSEDVYFGLGIATRLTLGLVLIASVILGRPIAATILPSALELPLAVAEHDAWKSAMVQLTLLAGLYFLCSGAVDTIIYRRSSVEGYVIVRFLANWPLSALVLAAGAIIVRRQLSRIDKAPTLLDLVDASFAPQPAHAHTDRLRTDESGTEV